MQFFKSDIVYYDIYLLNGNVADLLSDSHKSMYVPLLLK